MTDAERPGRIDVSIEAGVASIRLDNPARRNALTRQMCLDLQALMPELEHNPDVLVVTIRGAGDGFSAGAAINDLKSVIMDVQADGTEVDHLSRADAAIAALSKPTVALVDGVCMGGGWQVASACDFIVASERSTFALTPAKIGIIYPRAGIERLVRQVGHANAKFILLTGEPFDATRALELGLVAETVADADFEERCAVVIDALRSRSRFSTHYMKRLVNLTAAHAGALDEEWDAALGAMTTSPDMAIGISAFLNRETPEFTWRPTA